MAGATGSTFTFLAGALAGLGGGVLSGLFGVGGGIVLIPLLALLLGLNQHQAQGVTLAALLLPNSLPAVLHFRSRGIPIHWPLVGAIVVAFLPGVWAGAKVANRIPEGPLRIGFVCFLLLLALRTFLQKRPAVSAVELPPMAPPWAPGLIIGLVGGCCAGLLGIGGGVVMIPMLVLWLKLPQHEAQLVSIAVLLPPVGLPGVLVYAKSQPAFPWLILIGLALGFQLGAFGGARIATRIAGPRLQRIFAGVMVALAAMLLLR
ncbi:MAG: sulfite exporter TauE/SafE family protein [Holophaga sp.]|nr:sulfite exporter TauE/SafE family protein [Holophaga sp.]